MSVRVAGLLISDYPVASEPISHTFVAENVAIKDGTLQLLVSAEGAQTDVKSAEVFTEGKFSCPSVLQELESPGDAADMS